jgi:hypothetical protein
MDVALVPVLIGGIFRSHSSQCKAVAFEGFSKVIMQRKYDSVDLLGGVKKYRYRRHPLAVLRQDAADTLAC